MVARTACRTFLTSRTLLRPTVAPAMCLRARQYSTPADASKEAETGMHSEHTADAKSEQSNSETPPTMGVSSDGEKSSSSSSSSMTTTSPASDAETSKLQTMEKQLAEMKDKYIRQVAEYRNLQTRTERDVNNAKQFALQNFAKDLIESVDNLERALETVPAESRDDKAKNPDLVSLYGGLKMTESILMKTLERHGLFKFTGMGEKFNPNLHEVLYEALIPDKEPGTIMQVQTTGYTLNGRTIRAAKVGVVKSSES